MRDRGRPVHPRPAGARQPGAGRRRAPTPSGSCRCSCSTRRWPAAPPTATGSCTRRSPTCATTLRGRGGDLVVRHRRPGRRDDRGWPSEVGAEGVGAGRRRQRATPGAGSSGCAPECERHRLAAAAVPRRDRGRPRRAAAGRRRRPLPGLHARTTGPGRRRRGGTRWPPRADRGCPTGVPPAGCRRPPAGESPRRGRRAARPRAPAPAHRPGCKHIGPVRRHCTTTWPATAPRGSARTCASVASRRSSVANAAPGDAGPRPFVRQLCWRDFYYQVTARVPEDLAPTAYRRPATDEWRDDDGRAAGLAGRVAPGCRSWTPACGSCGREGWMHNRARLITAAFLTKHLGIDWRAGRAVVLPLAARRRRGEQLRQLAVGGRHRQRHQAVPPVQPDPAGPAFRPGRRVRSALRTRTEAASRARPCTSRGGCPRACGPAWTIRVRWSRTATRRFGCGHRFPARYAGGKAGSADPLRPSVWPAGPATTSGSASASALSIRSTAAKSPSRRVT